MTSSSYVPCHACMSSVLMTLRTFSDVLGIVLTHSLYRWWLQGLRALHTIPSPCFANTVLCHSSLAGCNRKAQGCQRMLRSRLHARCSMLTALATQGARSSHSWPQRLPMTSRTVKHSQRFGLLCLHGSTRRLGGSSMQEQRLSGAVFVDLS